MTLKALFSKKERARIRAEKMKAQAAAELAAKKVAIRKAPEVIAFIRWYEDRVVGKRDKDINYVQLGYEAHDRYWQLVRQYPEIAVLTGHEIEVTAINRVYSWIDGEASWYNWEYDKMEAHYRRFIEQEARLNLHGDYSLREIGPMGSSRAYESVAYLSYAYYESWRWQKTIQALRELIV